MIRYTPVGAVAFAEMGGRAPNGNSSTLQTGYNCRSRLSGHYNRQADPFTLTLRLQIITRDPVRPHMRG